jgi:uncharacterized protein GlcG (DUF336 family)
VHPLHGFGAYAAVQRLNGISGATSDEDEACAIAGIQAAGLSPGD